MKKLLLVIPENSYKSNDFVVAAEKLGIDFLIITDSEQVSSKFSDTVIINKFDAELNNNNLKKLKDVTHVLPVDHSALKFSGYLVDLLEVKGNKLESINLSMNKYESRKIFNSLLDIKVNNEIIKNIDDVNTFINKNGTSVLKPIYGTASKSVLKINNVEKNKEQIEKLMQDCFEQDLVIEE